MSDEKGLIVGTLSELNISDVLCHPLYVGISSEDNLKISRVENDFIGMISTEPLSETKTKLFVSVKIIRGESDRRPDHINLHVTKMFLEHYNYKSNTEVLFKPVYCLPLEKVVIGVKNENCYQSLKKRERVTGLLMSVYEQRVLCRAGDILFIPPEVFDTKDWFDLITLECYPVAQGILDIHTEVIIVKIDANDKVNVKASASHQWVYNSFRSLNITHSRLETTRREYNIHILPQLPHNWKCEPPFDPINTIFVRNEILGALAVQSGNWVKISLCESVSGRLSLPDILNGIDDDSWDLPDMDIGCSSDRVARIACIEELFQNEVENSQNVVFISPVLWFNLNQHSSPFLYPNARLRIEEISNQRVPEASEITVALVQSPDIDTTLNFNTLLKNYFKIPRFLCHEDIIAISSHDDATLQEKIDVISDVRWPVIYFKVSQMEGPLCRNCYLTNNRTSIYQVGTVNSYIPVTMDIYCSPSPCHPIWEVPQPPGINSYVEQLCSIVKPYLKLKDKVYDIKPHILLMGTTGCGKVTVVKSLCRQLNMHLFQVNCHNLIGDIPGSTESRFKATFEKAVMCGPCILLLRNIEVIGKEKGAPGDDPKILNLFFENLNELNKNLSGSRAWPVIVIGTTSKPQQLNTHLFTSMIHHLNMEVPSEAERKLIISALFSTVLTSKDVSIAYLAQRTAGFVLGDFIILLSKTLMATYARLKKMLKRHSITWEEEIDVGYSGVYILQKDIMCALEQLQSSHAQSVGAPKIPNVYWEDVGGLADVKEEILDTIQLPLQHPELMAAGLRRSGVLLYGPPGTGKTLLAKAVATECCLNFLSVKGPELINMYVGQSEENVREVFHRARNATPCVIFFDELDSLAPNRGRSGDSGGVMDRVVSQLLAELDGLNKSAEVFVIGATNRPDLLDPALLRPGRFDRLVYVGIPKDTASRVLILKALTRKIPLAVDVSLEEISNKSPPNMTGADFYSLCSNSVTNAIGRNIKRLENGEPEADVKFVIESGDFDVALETLVPSVSPEELQRFNEIKQNLS